MNQLQPIGRFNAFFLFSITILVLLFFIFFVELIRTAWISDDAGITLRTVLNFLNGYGARFNIDERVQGYTHPLWFLLLSATSYLVGNVYYSTFTASIVVSLLTLYLVLFRIKINFCGRVIVGLALILSKSYLDFSTSGLENPLSHFLIAFIIISGVNIVEQGQRGPLVSFCLGCGLLYLNRADLVILVAPFCCYVLCRAYLTIAVGEVASSTVSKHGSRKNVINTASTWVLFKAVFVGVLPVLLWTAFSVYYYGFPFPNTAYAKLATGIPYLDRVAQGFRYAAHFVQTDLLAALIVLTGIVAGFIKRDRIAVTLSIGIALYLLYVVSIGGDFMTGRFFTAPFFMAAIQLGRAVQSPFKSAAVIALILAVGGTNIQHTLLSGRSYSNPYITPDGISDERAFYFQTQGLLTDREDDQIFSASKWLGHDGDLVVTCSGLGFKALAAGPSIHIIDACALTDPLLARMTAIAGSHRIGHFFRSVPSGYTESIARNQNLIDDDQTRDLYELIRLITRGELNDARRLKAIFILNSGTPKHRWRSASPMHRHPIAINETIYFKKQSKGSFFLGQGASEDLLTNGWASPENWGVWSTGKVARLSLPIPTLDNPRSLQLNIQVILPSELKQQTIEVYLVTGGASGQDAVQFGKISSAQLLDTLTITAQRDSVLAGGSITIPVLPPLSEHQNINIEFKFPNPVRPRDLNLNDDERELTMGLISATFFADSGPNF